MATRIIFHEEKVAVVGTGWTPTIIRDVTTADVLSVSVVNEGDGNITGIQLFSQVTNAGDYVPIPITSFTEIGPYTRGASDEPDSILSGDSVIFHIGTEFLAGVMVSFIANEPTTLKVCLGGYSE